MKRYFSLSEFILRKDMPVPIEVSDKILRYHLWPLNEIRQHIGCPVHISQASGYRPLEHEKQKGRDGTSQHTFQGKGAVDLTAIKPRMYDLAVALIQKSDYTRICYYPDNHFLHCDYKGRGQNLFIGPAWESVDQRTFLNTLKDS